MRTMFWIHLFVLFYWLISSSTASETLEDTWASCQQYPALTQNFYNCLCLEKSDQASYKVDCNGVVFQEDFPRFIPRQPIVEFAWTNVFVQNLSPQVFLPYGLPLEKLDLSRNKLRRISDKALQGLSESLDTLDFSFNLLGDQLNPIFSSQEFGRLPRLRVLRLGHNEIRKLDNGILQGALSLQEFHLEGNELMQIPSEALLGPKSLRLLNLENNFIQEIGRDDLVKQRNLVVLNLNHNQIHTLASSSLSTLHNLKMLLLSWNRLQRLNSDAFTGLDSLAELNISNNFLTEIPRIPLSSLTRLQLLDLSANLIHNVTFEDLTVLKSLRELRLSRNRLTIIPENAFSNLRHLDALDLSVNQLRTIPKKLFHGLHLRSLDLSDNNLLLFPMDALHSIHGLRDLALDFNRISAIQGIPTLNLTRLSIANNLIRQIPGSALTHLVELEHLNLHGNQIPSTILEEILFPQSLLTLDISRNNLTTLPRVHLPLLKTLDASQNHLHTILPHNFILVPSLEKLNLQRNEIYNISFNGFEGLGNLTSLNISSNSISISRMIGPFPALVELDLSNNHLTHLHESMLVEARDLNFLALAGNRINAFRGLPREFSELRTLDLSNNKITYVFPHSFENASNTEVLDFSGNQLTFFPTDSLPQSIRTLSLASNSLRHIHEVSFANLPRLRLLSLKSNVIETLPTEPFVNSSQLQFIDLSNNKIEELGENLFTGLLRLEVNASNNFISHLPPQLFSRSHVHRLHAVDLSSNVLTEVPIMTLQPQIFFLEKLALAGNKIIQIPPNSNVLVNVKELDISNNPLSTEASLLLLNEPKTTRILRMVGVGALTFPLIEIPFLRLLDFGNNLVRDIPIDVFKRTTLLNTLLLNDNPLEDPPSDLPHSLTHLDLSGAYFENLKGTPFPSSLLSLKLNGLKKLSRLEKSSLKILGLEELEIRDTPKLGYIDVRGILSHLRFLKKLDFEVKDTQILDQVHPALSPRLSSVGLRGKYIRTISTGALAGLTAPRIEILLTNTSLNALPPILVPVPASSDVTIDISDSNIHNILPPFLSQNIRIHGINPHCDCNAIHLINYLKNIQSTATCSSPPTLLGIPILQIQAAQLLCSANSGRIASELSSTLRSAATSFHATFPTTSSTTAGHDDIIWSLPQTPATQQSSTNQKSISNGAALSPKQTPPVLDTNAMDNLILGIVGGVIGLLLLFILTLLACLKKGSGKDRHGHQREGHHHGNHPQKCTCKSPYHHHTMRSHHSLYLQPPPPTIIGGNHPLTSLQPLHFTNGGTEFAQPTPQQLYASSLPYFLQFEPSSADTTNHRR